MPIDEHGCNCLLNQADEERFAEDADYEASDGEDEDLLSGLPSEELLKLTQITKKVKGLDDPITWKICKAGEDVTVGNPPEPPKIDIVDFGIDFTKQLSDIFFDEIFADVKGHGKIIDEYLSDVRASYHHTYTTTRLKMECIGEGDPDRMVKLCYLLLIAGATEVESGVVNLFNSGPTGGRHQYPDFGKYVNVKTFKMFMSAAPYAFCKKKFWFLPDDESTFEIFLPVLDSMNKRRKTMFDALLKVMLLDESILEWRPSTSKKGGAPHLVWEPRKPVPMGVMLHNSICCATGIMQFQDPVEEVELQRAKKYFGEPSSLPCGSLIDSGVSLVCRQVEGSGLKPDTMVLGDAYFGGVMACVELRKRFDVYSTFVVKGHTYLFPKAALGLILNARHGKATAGACVAMTTTIAGVEILATIHGWSQTGRTLLISTAGSSATSEYPYTSHFEDEFGRLVEKEIPRPKVAHFYYQYNYGIDEHNRQRQGALRLEKTWPTKDIWIRTLTSTVGMAVVDMHRLMKMQNGTRYGNMTILKFADMLVGELEEKPGRSGAAAGVTTSTGSPAKKLKPTALRKEVDSARARDGTSVGSSVQKTCFMCRKYHVPGKVPKTSHQCPKCDTWLCNVSRMSNPFRTATCFDEHCNSQYDEIRCTPGQAKGRFPKHLKHSSVKF